MQTYQSKLQTKIHNYDKVERQLAKLKHHVKMKRRMYGQQQFLSLNSRIKECQSVFKREKYKVMRDAAQRVITESDMRNDMYQEVKSKLQMSRKARIKPNGINGKQAQKYNINVKTEQSTLQNEKVVMEYQLTPAKKGYIKHFDRSRVKTVSEEKLSHSRYISEFEKSIKEQLSRLPFDTISQTSEQIDFRRQNKSESKVFKGRSLKLPPLSIQRQNYMIQNYIPRKGYYKQMALNSQKDHYLMLREQLNQKRSNIKELQNRQINKIKHDKMDKLEKSRMLKGISSRLQDKSKYGDDNALDMMSKATLARADIFLLENE